MNEIEEYNKSLLDNINEEFKKVDSTMRLSMDDIKKLDELNATHDDDAIYDARDSLKNIEAFIRKDRETKFYFAVVVNYNTQSITLITHHYIMRDIKVSDAVIIFLDEEIYTSKFNTANKVKTLIVPFSYLIFRRVMGYRLIHKLNDHCVYDDYLLDGAVIYCKDCNAIYLITEDAIVKHTNVVVDFDKIKNMVRLDEVKKYLFSL